MSLTVLLTKKFNESDILFMRENLDHDIKIIIPKNYGETGLMEEISNANVLLGPFVTEKLIVKAKSLKFIQIPWTGVDTLNYELLRKFSITVCNSHSNSNAVAEHAVALMMAASKKIVYHDRLMREGNWNRGFNNNNITPFSKGITNANIGFIGFGAISKRIYALTKGFECNYYAFTNTGKLSSIYADVIVSKFPSFYKKAKNLDYLFICVPLTDKTIRLIKLDEFKCLSPECIVINVSRGEVIDEKSLYRALDEKIILGAGIDTWYNYPSMNNPKVFPSIDHEFHMLDNLILSPHRAGYLEGDFPHLKDAIENLNRANRGKELKNIISLEKKY